MKRRDTVDSVWIYTFTKKFFLSFFLKSCFVTPMSTLQTSQWFLYWNLREKRKGVMKTDDEEVSRGWWRVIKGQWGRDGSRGWWRWSHWRRGVEEEGSNEEKGSDEEEEESGEEVETKNKNQGSRWIKTAELLLFQVFFLLLFQWSIVSLSDVCQLLLSCFCQMALTSHQRFLYYRGLGFNGYDIFLIKNNIHIYIFKLIIYYFNHIHTNVCSSNHFLLILFI